MVTLSEQEQDPMLAGRRSAVNSSTESLAAIHDILRTCRIEFSDEEHSRTGY